MKIRILSILALLAVSFLMFSCKSTPKPDPAVDEAAAAVLARIEQSRQRAMDFEVPSYFPSEWEAAEAELKEASEMPRTDAAETVQVIARFNAVAATYDELFNKTIPLYAQAREDEIMAIRSEVINSGFSQVFPDFLQAADDMALEAKAQYEAADYYKAKDTAAKALGEYENLLLGTKVFLARQEVIDRGFAQYALFAFEKADELSAIAVEQYEAGNKEGAIETAEEALLRYNLVLESGWSNYVGERRAAAIAERELAIEEKANVASRDLFREADTMFAQAEENLEAENIRAAALLFIDSEARFAISREDTEERRQKALEAIKLAEEKIEESNEAAIEAERLIEGGSR